MTHFLVEYNNKVIGTYNDYDLAETFILSCLQNNLMQGSAKILKFRQNSCYYNDEYNITLYNNVKPSHVNFLPDPVFIPASQHVIPSNVIPSETSEEKVDEKPVPVNNVIDFTKPEVIEIAKQKIELQHNINLLKVHKQRIEESKKIYENDLKLFDIFTNNISKDPNFIIPPIFEDKYRIFKMLKEEGTLSWEHFTSLHKKENYYGDYFGVNDYEEYFMKSNKKENDDLSEELEIESSSETETSEN